MVWEQTSPQTLYCVCPLCRLSWGSGSDLGLWDGMSLQSGAVCKSRHITSDDQIPSGFHSRSDKPACHLSTSGLNLPSTCSLFVFQLEGQKWVSISETTSWLDIMTYHCAARLSVHELCKFRTTVKLRCLWLRGSGCSARSSLATEGPDGFLGEQICF